MRLYEQTKEIRAGRLQAPEDGSWVSILAEVRTEKYVDGQDGVRITEGGAGPSKLYIVEKDGVKKFFKQNEDMPSGDPKEHMEAEC